MIKYRAQIRDDDDTKWNDGGLFRKKSNAKRDAEILAGLFGNETRVIEVEVES